MYALKTLLLFLKVFNEYIHNKNTSLLKFCPNPPPELSQIPADFQRQFCMT